MDLARAAAVALAAAVLAWMGLLQWMLTPGVSAPWPLFVALAVAWLVALALLATRPRIGGVFAALLGLAAATGALQTHGRALAAENVALAVLALAAGVAGVVVARRAR